MPWIIEDAYVKEPCACYHARVEHIKGAACWARALRNPLVICACTWFHALPEDARAS